MPESQAWLAAARSSHDRLKALVADLAPDEVTARSYAKEWTLAQVLSHLGSQAELFCLLLDAGLTGGSAPGQATMLPIWQRWDALPPDRNNFGPRVGFAYQPGSKNDLVVRGGIGLFYD